jgi:hypothetical protein
MSKTSVRIEDWSVVEDLISERYCDLHPGNHLTGYPVGHVSRPNTKFIYISRIVNVDPSKGLVETLNTTYHLGEVNAEYQRWDGQRKTVAA